MQKRLSNIVHKQQKTTVYGDLEQKGGVIRFKGSKDTLIEAPDIRYLNTLKMEDGSDKFLIEFYYQDYMKGKHHYEKNK